MVMLLLIIIIVLLLIIIIEILLVLLLLLLTRLDWLLLLLLLLLLDACPLAGLLAGQPARRPRLHQGRLLQLLLARRPLATGRPVGPNRRKDIALLLEQQD